MSSSEPFFQPFEGPSYQAPQPYFPGRLLVLGESHYVAEEDKHHDFTRDLLTSSTEIQ